MLRFCAHLGAYFNVREDFLESQLQTYARGVNRLSSLEQQSLPSN